MKRIRRFFALDRTERRDLVAAALRVVAARLLLSTIGVARTRRLLDRRSSTNHAPEEAERAARAVLRAANNLPLQANCLDRAVALWWLLSSRGLAATLRIGVRKNGDLALAAHAWVEHDASVLLDDRAAGYTPLETPPTR
jgi:aryl-alcohol dehydrogenase-like predicted oxidoreductase